MQFGCVLRNLEAAFTHRISPRGRDETNVILFPCGSLLRWCHQAAKTGAEWTRNRVPTTLLRVQPTTSRSPPVHLRGKPGRPDDPLGRARPGRRLPRSGRFSPSVYIAARTIRSTTVIDRQHTQSTAHHTVQASKQATKTNMSAKVSLQVFFSMISLSHRSTHVFSTIPTIRVRKLFSLTKKSGDLNASYRTPERFGHSFPTIRHNPRISP